MSTPNHSNNNLNEKSFLFWTFMGVLCSVVAVLMLWIGINDYTTQLKQVDWPITEATVLYVEEKIETSHSGRHSRSTTHYDTYYQYFVNVQKYEGNYERVTEVEIGETIKIKYDPNEPGYSTGTLKPSLAGAIIGIVMGMGAVISFVLARISRKKYKQNNDG